MQAKEAIPCLPIWHPVGHSFNSAITQALKWTHALSIKAAVSGPLWIFKEAIKHQTAQNNPVLAKSATQQVVLHTYTPLPPVSPVFHATVSSNSLLHVGVALRQGSGPCHVPCFDRALRGVVAISPLSAPSFSSAVAAPWWRGSSQPAQPVLAAALQIVLGTSEWDLHPDRLSHTCDTSVFEFIRLNHFWCGNNEDVYGSVR